MPEGRMDSWFDNFRRQPLLAAYIVTLWIDIYVTVSLYWVMSACKMSRKLLKSRSGEQDQKNAAEGGWRLAVRLCVGATQRATNVFCAVRYV